MLDFDYIKEHTIWIVRFTAGRTTCKEKDLKLYMNNEDVRDIEPANRQGQPKELQEFYKDYEYAFYEQRRHDLFLVKDFYDEWIKNPSQFKPEHKKVISNLLDELEKLDDRTNILIENFNGYNIGNHLALNYKKALQTMELNFDVIKVDDSYSSFVRITIQCDEEDLVRELTHRSYRAILDETVS